MWWNVDRNHGSEGIIQLPFSMQALFAQIVINWGTCNDEWVILNGFMIVEASFCGNEYLENWGNHTIIWKSMIRISEFSRSTCIAL